jgi:hypothetical protein
MDTLSRRQLLARRVRQGVVGTLVGLLAGLEPAMLLAQGPRLTPPMQPPHRQVPRPVDAVVDAITADIITTAKDAHQHGPRPEHLKRHASNLRALAKHYKTNGLDAQVIAWAKAQNPDVFELQVPDRATVDAALAARRQQGLPVDDLLAAVNASPKMKRAVLMAFRAKGISGNLEEDAAYLERVSDRAIQGAEPRITPALVDMTVDAGGGGDNRGGCQTINYVSILWGFASFLFGGWIGTVVTLIGMGFSIYNAAGCPGLPPDPRTGPGGGEQAVPRQSRFLRHHGRFAWAL